MTKETPNKTKQPDGEKRVTEEAVLRVAKEVVVKFIEVGRLSPQNFDEIFGEIYRSVKNAVRSAKK